jgi:hypothetical protein
MAREITKRQIETAKKIIQKEKYHRTDPQDWSNHHDISNRKRQLKEMDFLERLIERLFEENDTLKKQPKLV